MGIDELYDILRQDDRLQVIGDRLQVKGDRHLLLSGLYGSSRAIALKAIVDRCAVRSQTAALSDVRQQVMVVVMDSQEEAQYMFGDLRELGSKTAALSEVRSQTEVLYFPTAHRRRQGVDEAMAIQRTEVLANLVESGKLKSDRCADRSQTAALSEGEKAMIIVTYPEALCEEVPAVEDLKESTRVVKVGERIAVSALQEQLLELGFEKVDFVYEPGQFAVRGGIVDVFSYSHEDPYRLDFFGDEVDSIRTFDIETQLSVESVGTIEIVGNAVESGKLKVESSRLDEKLKVERQGTIMDYLPEGTVWVSNDWTIVKWKVESLKLKEVGIVESWKGKDTIEIRDKSTFENYEEVRFNTLPQPAFNKNFEILEEDLREHIKDGYTIYILADQKKQLDRLEAVFESGKLKVESGKQPSSIDSLQFTGVDKTLHAGWVDKDLKVCCYTDHEIFERYHRVALKSENARRGKAIETLKEINQLRLGDYVVHTDHGIGQFGGLVTTMVNGKQQEMIKLIYRDGDTIFVSIHNLHRISKYKGKEGSAPTISRIGSSAWERLKERTKDKVKDIARDLIQLYATRKKQQGFAYTPDGYMQHELEASFLYEDTPDQAKATVDVKHDMESAMPMDRLVCGDVGFGKTEVAMRAAFKAATDGKQVAVLVPTTVLALQHYQTFRDRFKNFPVRVEYLSRAKTAQQVRNILADLKEGKIDILIGTHKLVGKNVEWKDLGLLIIDEEQKFGVAVKEKIKSLRTNIDVLTLTATPIPRTLQFSLLGARDLSVMTTPPQNRYPVQTEVIGVEDEDIIKEAIDLEMQRNGQVFVVNNRIEMLDRIEQKIHRLCPEARIVTAHGQMPMEEMEERLEAFINYDYDILVSTTIIESGVDIPNVNTMIIYSAQHYGLSDLHQLRGRVGRSNRKAYCYLVTPERELLTPEARRRLDAIVTFAELGSGFNLAMQDLDIRGAGNLLGAEQSGFIAELGYETYQRILSEAVEELHEELQVTGDRLEVTADAVRSQTAALSDVRPMNWCGDSQLESDLALCFPSTYIENISERITLYRELDGLRNEDELTAYKKRLIDRFGPLPEEAEELLNVVRLRWLCCLMGIEKIYLKGERMTLYFVMHKESYWQSEAFGKIVKYVYQKGDRCQMREEKGKRFVTIGQVKTIGGAINLLTKVCGM